MNLRADDTKQDSGGAQVRVRAIALLFSAVCGLFSLGMALWLLSVTQAPSVANSVENFIGVWMMIITFDLLTIIYLPTALLLLLEVKQVRVVSGKVTLAFWFLGQVSIAQDRRVHEIGRSRVVRFGESDKRWERVRVVFIAPIYLCSFAQTVMNDGLFLRDGRFSKE